MEYDAKTEMLVFLAVQELGEASLEEVQQYMKDHLEKDLDKALLLRYLRRWKAKKIFALNTVDNIPVFKLADIPPWYASGIMAIAKGSTNVDMRTAIEALDEKLKEQGRIIQPRGVYGEYKSYELTFETLDVILGGRISGSERELSFPERDGVPIIPMNWFHGWIRDNAALVNLPQSITHHIAWSNGEFIETPKLQKKTLKVKEGLATYEAIPVGVQFKAIMRVPMRGTTLKTEEQIRQWFEALAVAPLRGLGANPRAYGGRVKLLEMKEIA